MYKVYVNLYPKNTGDMFVRANDDTRRVTRVKDTHNFVKPRVRLEMSRSNFRVKGVEVWEMVPGAIKLSKSLEIFKANIKLI